MDENVEINGFEFKIREGYLLLKNIHHSKENIDMFFTSLNINRNIFGKKFNIEINGGEGNFPTFSVPYKKVITYLKSLPTNEYSQYEIY